VVERSPEKAGVGGSTPSLATIIPKDLRAFVNVLQPEVQRKISLSLDSWSDCAYRCIGRSDLFVTQNPCTVFESQFSFTSEEASECRKVWNSRWKRTSLSYFYANESRGRSLAGPIRGERTASLTYAAASLHQPTKHGSKSNVIGTKDLKTIIIHRHTLGQVLVVGGV
jgi:hypothetical protein